MRSAGKPGASAPRSPSRLFVAVAACLLVVAALPAAKAEPPTSAAVPALRESPVKQYRALRLMHARADKFNQEAWVDCWTELDDQGFRYEIVSERGSEYVRDKVLKALLMREKDVIAAGGAGRAEFTDDNYEFADAPERSGGERHLLLKPRRKDVLLVDGRLVLNQDGTELLRVEGRLAKNPSFWTNLVDVVREFARVDGVRVPISTDTVARIRFAGVSRMDVRYHYESINGRPVSVEARQSQSMIR